MKTNRKLRFYCVNCCLITVNTKNDNSYLSAFYFKWYETKMTTFFIDNSVVFIRFLRKCTENLKAIGQLEKKLWHCKEMQNPTFHSVRQEGKLRPTTVNNVKTMIGPFQLFSVVWSCFQLFEVFEVFDPLLSPIAPYPYLFTQWPHRLWCSTHVNTMLSTVASIRVQQCFCFH